MKRLRPLTLLAACAGLALLAAASLPPAAIAAQSQINTLESNGVAIKGYDPVAYFTEGAPRKGRAEFSADHAGAKWHFASAANKALFEADPAKYTPAYGGYCAYGVASGYLVKIDPDAWAVRDGKLYLNYDRSVQKSWSRKPAQYIADADRKWPGLVAK